MCFFTVLLLYFKQIFFSILTNPSYRLYTLSIMKITLDTDIGFKNPNSDVDFNIWDRPSSDLHDHTFYEVFIVTQGELRHIVNGKKETLRAGDVQFIRPQDCHLQQSTGDIPAKTVNLSFTPKFLYESNYFYPQVIDALQNPSTPMTYRIDKKELDYVLFSEEKLLQARNIDIETQLVKQLILLCFNLLPVDDKYDSYPQWLRDFIQKLRNPQNFTQPLHALSRTTNYSNTTLSLLFKKHTGQTVISFFCDAKIKYACNLLKNTNFSTLEISNRLGYFSLSHFNHIFKSKKNMTPTDYRNKYQPHRK